MTRFPFIRQPDAMDCGPACLGMIAGFYEKDGDAIKERNRLGFLWKYLVKYRRFFTQLIIG